jgi:hypothetical protein
MVIKHGQDWGREAIAPSDLVVASSDAELAAHVGDGKTNIVVTGGDMWRTIGADSRVVAIGESATCLPIDIMKVECRLADQSLVSKIVAGFVDCCGQCSISRPMGCCPSWPSQ